VVLGGDGVSDEYIAPCYNCQCKIPVGAFYVYAYRGNRGPDIFCDYDCMRDAGYSDEGVEVTE
jgi:hypothetical protein